METSTPLSQQLIEQLDRKSERIWKNWGVFTCIKNWHILETISGLSETFVNLLAIAWMPFWLPKVSQICFSLVLWDISNVLSVLYLFIHSIIQYTYINIHYSQDIVLGTSIDFIVFEMLIIEFCVGVSLAIIYNINKINC